MKHKLGLISMLLVALLTACEHYDVNDTTFTFNLVYKQSTFAVYDVYPSVNGFEYTTFVCTLDELERLGTNGLIDSVYYTLNRATTYTKGKRTVLNDLVPGTEYFMCCFRLNSRHEPVYQLVKKAFNTPAEEGLTIEVAVTAKHDTLVLTPTTSQSYYWSYSRADDIKDRDKSSILYGFYNELAYYENYNMLQYMVCIGESEDAVFDYYPQSQWTNGDTLVLAVSPYNLRTGYCPEPDMLYVMYQDGTFVNIEKPGTQSAPGRRSCNIEDKALLGKNLVLPRLKREAQGRR